MRLIAAAIVLAAGLAGASAQGLLGQEKQILPMVSDSWVAFRDYDGKQWIYFTTLVTYHCGLSEIRYSIDSDALDKRFPLPACDRQRPNAIDPVENPPYLTFRRGSARQVMVQVVFSDGEVSEAHRYAPCDNPGDSACAVLAATPLPDDDAPILPSAPDRNVFGQRQGQGQR